MMEFNILECGNMQGGQSWIIRATFDRSPGNKNSGEVRVAYGDDLYTTIRNIISLENERRVSEKS